MTLIRMGVLASSATGEEVVPRGSLDWEPSERRVEGDDVILASAFCVQLADPIPVVEIAATGPGWCWHVTERVGAGIVRHVLVPESGDVIDYADLVDVDPDTLDPAAPPEAAWWIALRDVAAGAIDPEIVNGAVADAMAGHVDDPTPHPAYDVDMPSLVVLLENGLA